MKLFSLAFLTFQTFSDRKVCWITISFVLTFLWLQIYWHILCYKCCHCAVWKKIHPNSLAHMYTIWSNISRHPSVVVNWSLDVTTTALTGVKGCRKLCVAHYRSLWSSTCSMGRSGELSDFKCELFIGCHISKKSVRDIATLLKLPKLTVGDLVVKWKCEGTTTMKPWLGRPHLMTGRDHRALKKVVRETRQTLSETITREFHSATNCPSQHHDCASKVMRMMFHAQAAAHKPNISPVNAKRHLKLCKERRHWTVDSWKRVISGDESCYTMWRSDGRVWV
jgi:hypothetical protein